MALEDFTTYTEVDSAGDITVAANLITVDTMRRDADSYVKYSYPANTFGNFVHTYAFNWTASSADTAVSGVWMLSNSSYTLADAITNNDGICSFLYRAASNNYRFNIYYNDTAAEDYIQWTSAPGQRYVRVQRNGTQLVAVIYTDAAMTTIEDTLVLTVPNTAYANIVFPFSRDSAPTDTPSTTYTVGDLNLQFAVAAGGTVTTTGGDGIKARSSSIVPPAQKARKPYLSLKQSMSDFFSEHVRFIKDQARGPESAFEKPYLDYEYPTMHLSIPAPDWGGGSSRWWYKPGDWVPSADPNGGARPVPGCPGCALYADPPLDCEHPVEIHSGIWCTNTPGAQTKDLIKMKTVGYSGNTTIDAQAERVLGERVDGVSAGDTRLEIYAKKGTIKQITIGAWASIGVSAAVFVDSTVASHTICGSMIDGAGSNCLACVDVNCACNCATVTSMTIDTANTDTTIAPGGTANITVLDGCGPFTWSVSGVGYVLDSLSTQGRSNKLTSITGTCGTVVAAYAVVTVVDDCGTVVTKSILSTAGTWKTDFSYGVTFTDCANCGNFCRPTNYGVVTYVSSSEIHRWKFDNDYNCVAGTCGMTWSNGANPLPPSPCITPAACAAAYNPIPCSGAGCTGTCDPSVAKSAPDHATRQVWGCP